MPNPESAKITDDRINTPEKSQRQSLEQIERTAILILEQINYQDFANPLPQFRRHLPSVEVALGSRRLADYKNPQSTVDGISYQDCMRLERLANALRLTTGLRDGCAADSDTIPDYRDAVENDLVPALHHFIRGSSQIQKVVSRGAEKPVAIGSGEIPQMYRDYLRAFPLEAHCATRAEFEAPISTLKKKIGPPNVEPGEKSAIEWLLVYKGSLVAVYHRASNGKPAKAVAWEIMSSDKKVRWSVNASVLFDYKGFGQALDLDLTEKKP